MSNAYPTLIELPGLAHNAEWDEPILFEEAQTPDIPAYLLPPALGDFAAALATTTETAESLAVMMLFGVVSTCLAKRFVISPKTGWQEPINIYTLLALPPANHKSQVVKACTRPLIEWEQIQRAALEKEIKYQRAERKNQEKWIESLRSKAAKEKDNKIQQRLFSEIAELEVNLITPPSLPLLFVNDATPEALALSAYEQGGRLAVFSDEGGILETLAGLYSHGLSNIDILLKGIDGGDMRIRRKDRHLHFNPFLTVVLAVQPVVLQRMGTKAIYQGNGTLERFLYVLPKSQLGYRTHDKSPIPYHIQETYHRKIAALLAIPPLDAETAYVLTLTPSAYRAWQAFQKTIEIQLRSDGKLANCQGWGGKICGFALRFAGLIHVAEAGEKNLVINEDTMDKAILLANLLIEHAIAAFNLMGVDEPTQAAKEILRWIMAHKKAFFSQSEIALAMRNKKFGKAERLAKALTVLMERNLIEARRIATRKPTTLYYVHPEVLESCNTFSFHHPT